MSGGHAAATAAAKAFADDGARAPAAPASGGRARDGDDGAGAASRRFAALVRKESVQVLRDPSALLIAFVLPFVLLFLFAYAVSLDVRDVPFGVVVESEGAAAAELAAAYRATPYLDARILRERRGADAALLAGEIRGYILIPPDFERRMAYGGTGDGRVAAAQLITDAAQPNTASFVAAYARGVFDTWLAGRGDALLDVAPPAGTAARASDAEANAGAGVDRSTPTRAATGAPPLALEPRFWFNAELESRRVLLPGALAIVMTMIGTLLTALVVAREWERGTMEALLSTPVSIGEVLAAKLVPYFALALTTLVLCTALSIALFDLPLRGSSLAFLALSVAFLVPALGQGLLISALARNQFVAAQFALLTGFLPAFLLSGFLFEIASMPWPIRLLTQVVAARWYVEGLQTVFLAGDVWTLYARDIAALLALGAVLVGLAVARSRRTLD